MGSFKHHTILPLVDHTHTVIFLHGRESTAEQFRQELFESQASDGRFLADIFPQVRWVFPQSKIRLSARFGESLSQWFDIWSTEDPQIERQMQLLGLRESVLFVRQVIEAELEIVPPSSVFLCGISQGCATAISTLMCHSQILGGFVGLCGWMPYEDEVRQSPDKLAALQKIRARFGGDSLTTRQDLNALATPVFIAHSQDDNVVPLRNGVALSQALQELGMQVTWKEYDTGEHWINEPQGIDDLVGVMTHWMRV